MIKGSVASFVSLDALLSCLPSVLCRTHNRRAWVRSPSASCALVCIAGGQEVSDDQQ